MSSTPRTISPKVEVYEEPPHFPNAKKTPYALTYSAFEKDLKPKKTDKKEKTKRSSKDGNLSAQSGPPQKLLPEPKYLIIGFDTEFKTPPVALTRQELNQGLGKYEVLSYQFHCISSEGQSWSGICCPEKGERLDTATFLVFVLAKGIAEKKLRKIPKKIYFAGHFTRADIPAFSDFKHLTSIISAVRNTFISLDQNIELRFPFKKSTVASINLILRDTMLLSPGTSKSLSAIGDLVGRPKIKLDNDPVKDKHFKQNMDQLRDQDWVKFKDYALNDAIICAEYLKRIISQTKTVLNKTSVPVTLSSIGIDLVKKSWEDDHGIEPLKAVGKETVFEKKWNKGLGRYETVKSEKYLEELHWHIDFVTETYHGGRNEQFWFGPSFEDNWTDYDLSSAYPTAMALIGAPEWTHIEVTKEIDKFGIHTLGFACIDFEFRDDVRYPTLPIRTNHGIIFPRKGRSYCSAPEVYLARQYCKNLTVRHGVIVPTNTNSKIFGKFIKDAIAERQRHPKKSFEALFWKEISNSTYGKTAQGLREKRVYDIRDRKMGDLPESAITNPFFASYITSFVRATLGEILNSLPDDKMAFSVTTDGFLTDANDAEMSKAEQGELGRAFAESRKWLTGTASVLEKKHEVKQLLGWRTRGQATLKAGTSQTGDASYNVVLARGGISLEDHMDNPQEQTDFICKRFFNRTPNDVMLIESLTGVRDIVEKGADLVGMKSYRQLNMEYDWKRKPHALGISQKHNHLIFSTSPWNGVDEFNSVRDLMDTYRDKDGVKVMKEISDLDIFTTYVDSKRALSKDDALYFSKKNGDIKRLRSCLCKAWIHGKAGFTKTENVIVSGKPLTLDTANNFAKFLTSISTSLQTNRYDVENSKDGKFSINSVPDTDKTQALYQLVKNALPNLIDGEIFAKVEKVSVFGTLKNNVCPFVSKVL